MRLLASLALITLLFLLRSGSSGSFWVALGFAAVALVAMKVLEVSTPREPLTSAGPPPESEARSARARTPLGRAVALRLEQPRLEDQGADELVSGRVGARGVTLRLGPRNATLSFDLPWRAAHDLTPTTLPPEVAAQLTADDAPGALSDPEAALVELFGALRCVRLQVRARRAHATLRVDGIDEAAAPAWARRALLLTGRLDGLIRRPITVDPVTIDGAGLVCPYCRDGIADEEVTPCAACGTLHHVECLAEAGGCTILGCRARPERDPRPGLRA